MLIVFIRDNRENAISLIQAYFCKRLKWVTGCRGDQVGWLPSYLPRSVLGHPRKLLLVWKESCTISMCTWVNETYWQTEKWQQSKKTSFQGMKNPIFEERKTILNGQIQQFEPVWEEKTEFCCFFNQKAICRKQQ